MNVRTELNRLEIELSDYPELISYIAINVRDTLLTEGTKIEAANAVALATAERLIESFGGQSIYVPKATITLVSRRNLKLYEEFDGKNAITLAHKYGLTVQRVYQIIKSIRSKKITK